MKINIGSFYYEVGVRFSISYKVILLIRQVLIEQNIFKIEDENTAFVEISAKSKIDEVVVKCTKLPNGDMDYLLYLPYHTIKSSDNELKAFIYYFFEGVKMMVAEEFDMELDRCREKIINETVNNPEYIYIDPMGNLRKNNDIN
ncbi:MAG: hypothetical protein AB8G22_02050 [Saprospiraceae bacterium]